MVVLDQEARVTRLFLGSHLGIRYPTFITNEFNTSKLSPLNFGKLQNVKQKNGNSKKGDRLRQCRILRINSSEAPLVSTEFSDEFAKFCH